MLVAQCAVCQEIYTDSKDCVLSALPCGHVFHKCCIDTWFRTSLTCPQCRIEVKRTKPVVRLFFDIVPLKSLSKDYRRSDENSNPNESHEWGRSQKQLNTELYRTLTENTRLEEALRLAEQKAEKQTKLASDREKEIATLTSLYKESDKLCEKERQRCRELRVELLSIKQFLREAESMKAEAIKLREEMEDMENVKKLLAASEDEARELLSRYTLPKDKKLYNPNDAASNLESLCRWTAVLRTELTSAREKARNYRIELSRLRKLNRSVLHRAAKAETKLAECNERVKQLEQDLSNTNSNSGHDRQELDPSLNNSTDGSLMRSPPIEQPKKPHPSTSMTTPDMLSTSITNPSTIELQKQLRTPLENPFRIKQQGQGATDYPCISRVSSLDFPSSSYHHPTPTHKAQNSRLDHSKSKPLCQRRPSVLYEMSIMRRRLHELNQPSTSTTSYLATSSYVPLAKQPRATVPNLYKRPNKSSKTKASTVNKGARLDSFLYKL